MKQGRFDIIWSQFITLGTSNITIQTDYRQGILFVDWQHWCEPCKKVCNRFGIGRISGGPLGELEFQPIEAPPL